MKDYQHITRWENNRRVQRLTEFREIILAYFSQPKDKRASETRLRINLALGEVMEIVYSANVNPTLEWTQAPAFGNRRSHINLLDNIFNLGSHDIPMSMVTDVLERTLGIYQWDYRKSVLRTYNPFWWIGQLLGWVGEFPFLVIGKAGFDARSAQQSLIGRLVKLGIWGGLLVPPAIASLLVIREYLNQ